MQGVLGKSFIQLARLSLHQAGFNSDAGDAQLLHSFAGNLRERVSHGHHDALDSGGNHNIGAGAGAAIVTARLKIQIERGAFGPSAGALQRQDFRMLDAVVSMKAGARDVPVSIHDDRADAGIGGSKSSALSRQIERLAHELFVLRAKFHSAANSDSTKFVALNGSRSPAFSPTPT